MPPVQVEPIIITQPPRLSRQQRRAVERKAAKELDAQNRQMAVKRLAEWKKTQREKKEQVA
jgi:hypothetical protein